MYRHWAETLSGDTSDDTVFSDKAIYQHLITSRGILLRQLIDTSKPLSTELYQTLSCIELEEADRVECPFIPASGCVWLKSVCPIPDFITIQSISTHLGASYSYTRWDRIKEKSNGRLSSAKKEKFYSYRTINKDTYLYIYNDDFIKNITATAIFEDPAEASAFCAIQRGEPSEALCSPMDTSFHTSQDLIDLVIKQTWDITLRIRSQAKLKHLNNDSPIDNTTAVPSQKKD